MPLSFPVLNASTRQPQCAARRSRVNASKSSGESVMKSYGIRHQSQARRHTCHPIREIANDQLPAYSSDAMIADEVRPRSTILPRILQAAEKALSVCWRDVMQGCDVIFAIQADSIPLVAF